MSDVKSVIESGRAVLGIEFGSTRIKAVLIGEDHAPIATGAHDWENMLVDGIWTYSLDMIWEGISDCYSKMAQEITLARVVQAGVVPMDTAAVASELQRTWNRPDAAEWAEVYTKVFPAYQLLIESYSKAQDVVKNNEQLDSQR